LFALSLSGARDWRCSHSTRRSSFSAAWLRPRRLRGMAVTQRSNTGGDNGIDHNKNWLRFPYLSTFWRSHHHLHPHPHPYYLLPGPTGRRAGGGQVSGAVGGRSHSHQARRLAVADRTPLGRGAGQAELRSCCLGGEAEQLPGTLRGAIVQPPPAAPSPQHQRRTARRYGR
jgi:hypothetical protein